MTSTIAISKGRRPRISKEVIVDIMRDRIADHILPPGSRIQEVDLAYEFDISRTVVREILTALEQRGLILRIPNRGAAVKRLDLKEIFEVFEVREVLEGLCVRLASMNAPAGAWDQFALEFGEPLRETIEKGKIELYHEALDRLRDETVRFAANHHAAQMLHIVLDKARIVRKRVTLLPGRAEQGRQMHKSMLEQMIARDCEGAERIKREIIRSARAAVERYHDLIC